MRIKRIRAIIIDGLLLVMLILPQLALAAGPEITYVSVPNITSTTATITWTTNTASDSRVNYGTNTTLGKTAHDSSKVNNHNILLEGLTPGTIYYFEVKSTDASGNSTDNNGGAYYSFTTLAITECSITLDTDSGVCGELIEVTATVAAAGTYRVCWDSLTAGGVKETFTATMAGSRTLMFYAPEATKSIHKVYLADNTYAKKAEASFEIFPSVEIDPNEGPVGTAVSLRGYGFTASQDIRVSFEGTVKTGKANTAGSWNVTHTIPPTPAGGYVFEVEAKEDTVWVGWVSKYFEVTPKITVTPSSGTVGQTVKVDGTGFASEEEDIEVTFDEEVVKKSVYADGDGSWSAVIAVPPLQSGRYIIDASGTSTRARDVPDVSFTVSAGILVEPSPAYVGDTITVAGGGFAPGETGIKVTFDGTVVATGIIADIDGSWESSFVLPASTSGNHTVSASGDITKPAVTTTLNTQAKIEGLSPVEGAPGDAVTLTGSGFNGNKKLTVTLAGTVVPGDMRTQTNGNVVISFRVPASTAGKQTVRVTDEGGATASANFMVKEKVLPTPLPTLPEDGSKVRSGRVTFHWQGITGSSNITYTLEISQTAGFGNIVRSKSVEENSYTLTEEEALPKGTYYWRVKAVDNYGNKSAWSSPSSFTASPIPTWVWVVVGVVVLVGLMVVAYRETKFKVIE